MKGGAKRTVLFLGCNTNQVSYMQAAQALGFRVVGTDRNPDAPGARIADGFHAVGYDDATGLLAAARAEGLGPGDRLFTAAAHFAWEGAAALAEALALPFPQRAAVDVCLDKTKLYPLLRRCGLDVPPTVEVAGRPVAVPDERKIWYLKSDYGKSPRYCARVEDGCLPALPTAHDPFWRRAFLLQEAIDGTHYRVDLWGEEAAVFLKLRDDVALPVPTLGPGHATLVARLRAVVGTLGLTAHVVKFDLIAAPEACYVIDLGLDPPMRLRLLCEHLGRDFAAAYVRHWLLGDAAALPRWRDVCRPVLISGLPGRGFSFTELVP